MGGVVRSEEIARTDNAMTTNQIPPTSSADDSTPLGEVIKLGIDVHIEKYVVVMKIDGSAPARAKRFTPEQFMVWVEKLAGRCEQLHSCYEAGPFGYSLHRRLEKMGVTNHVIRPINWDEHGKNVKTDARDATQMVLCLDGYLRGNHRSFSTVRVPSEAEEQRRSITRQRQSLMQERKRLAAKARGHVMYYGGRLQGEWWRPRRWKALSEELEIHVRELLEPLHAILEAIEAQIVLVEKRLEEMTEVALPKGMGTVIFEQMEREVCDWSRFETRKQVGGYTGLCPSEDTSDKRRFQGSITKHGNPRLRHMLIECVWLLIQWNPDYRGIVKWRDKLLEAKLTKASKKKIVVAIARQFAVDWWRIRTGKTTPDQLGLVMKPFPAMSA
jgi:transposase